LWCGGGGDINMKFMPVTSHEHKFCEENTQYRLGLYGVNEHQMDFLTKLVSIYTFLNLNLFLKRPNKRLDRFFVSTVTS